VDIWQTTNDAISEAVRAGIITPMDEGAVAVLRMLAETLDHPDFPNIDGKFDNVSQSLYLKFCESLGLTPAGRDRLQEKKDRGGGKLAQLRSIQGGTAAKAGGTKAGPAKAGTTRRGKAANGA